MNDDPLVFNFDDSQLEQVSILGRSNVDQAVLCMRSDFNKVSIGVQDVRLNNPVFVCAGKNPWLSRHADKLTCML